MTTAVGWISAATALVLVLCAPATSQRLNTPSPHFGSMSIPEPGRTAQIGLSLDSFTQFGRDVDQRGRPTFESYNGIDETIGLNFLNYSFSGQSRRWRSVFYRATTQIGYGHDEPTKSIQDWLHDSQGVRRVPRRDKRNDKVDAAFTLELNQWDGLGGTFQRFFGAGLTTGTTHQELFVQAGVNPVMWRSGRWDLPTLSAIARVGVLVGGDAFPSSGLTNAYVSAKAAARLPTGSLAREVIRSWAPRWLVNLFYVIPDLGLVLHRDSGFFADPSGKGIPETFGSLYMSFGSDALVIETWNDLLGSKDKGPTGGGRIYLRFWNISPRWLP